MILDLIARRTLLTAGAVGLGAALAVYAGNDWFHASLLPAVGLSNALGDALGSLFIVMAAFLCQRLVAAGLYRDWQFGLVKTQADAAGRSETLVTEDSSVRIEETRVGGQIRRIRVFPKDGQAPYDIDPVTRQRLWKIAEF